MKKYLDINGLSELWRRISTAFATKSDVEDGIAESLAEGGAVRGAIDASMERLSRVSETGSYLDLSDKPTAGLYRHIEVRLVTGEDKLYVDGADDLISAGYRPILLRKCFKRNKVRRGTSREGVAQGNYERGKKGWNAMGGQGAKSITNVLEIERDQYGAYLSIDPQAVWGSKSNYFARSCMADKFILWRRFVERKNGENCDLVAYGGRRYMTREAGNDDVKYYIRRFTYGVAFVPPGQTSWRKIGTDLLDNTKLGSNIAQFTVCHINGDYWELHDGYLIDEADEGTELLGTCFNEGALEEFVDDGNISQTLGNIVPIKVKLTNATYAVVMPACDNSRSAWVMLGRQEFLAELAQKVPDLMDPGTYRRTITKDTFESEHALVYYDGAPVGDGESDFCEGEQFVGYSAMLQQMEEDYETNAEPSFITLTFKAKTRGWHWCFGK